jgi:hypothetical protein
MAFRHQQGHQADPNHPGGAGKEDAHLGAWLPAQGANLTRRGLHFSETTAPPRGT